MVATALSGSGVADAPLAADSALSLRGVSKTFPGVRALIDVDLDVQPGTIHALLGHNGSGKSTLIKCLAGAYAPDPGATASTFGTELALGDATDAHRKGMRFVHQDLGIVLELGAEDNVGFTTGFARTRMGSIDWRRQRQEARVLLRRFGFDLDPRTPMALATPPQRAAVAIARAVSDWHDARGVLVLDEPTAALPAHEVDRLFALMREIRSMGAAVIFVSHRLDEVTAIADAATVLRDGRKIWSGSLDNVTVEKLVDVIVGESARIQTEEIPFAVAGDDAPVLEVKGLCGRYLRDVDFAVRPGEILGVAGLLGSGREELPYVLSGAISGTSGSVVVDGREVAGKSVARARDAGVVLVPADRATESIFDEFTTVENVSLGALSKMCRWGRLSPGRERRFAIKWLGSVNADARYGPRMISTLSGGNQQKAVLARALSVHPKVLVLSEPTAGIDIGARAVIYAELRRRAAEGLAIVMASSDVEDLLAACDRTIALRDGRVVADLSRDRMTKPSIAYAVEGAHE